ncbi:MAG: hypothetical protein H5T62_03790 [Anaerolineae bacterium]|nr:hypothetical protein [Anaerolineae bacterium]
MKRTAWGLLAMSLSFLLGTIIALGSMVAMRGKLDTATLTGQPLSVPTLLVSCLAPFAILLEIVAIILIVLDSRQVGRLHHRLSWVAVVFFVLWAIANLGGFLPLSLLGVQRGEVSIVKLAQMIKAGAAILQYLIPFLLAFSLTRKVPRVLLWFAVVLTTVGNFGVITLPIGGLTLQPVESFGQTMYAPQFAVDYTTGPYPILLALGYTGGALYMLVYALLTWQVWRGGNYPNQSPF